jgi:hypothetical protein
MPSTVKQQFEMEESTMRNRKTKKELTAKSIILDNGDVVESVSSPNELFGEARIHLAIAQMAYFLADMRLLSDTGYTPFSFDEVSCEVNIEGITNAQVLANVFRILRVETRGEKEGLAGTNLHKDRGEDQSLLLALEKYAELSLKDTGDPYEICPINTDPLNSMIDQHQHVGSRRQCLCTKFGLHHMQILLDRLVRTEDEKRKKEKVDSAIRGPPPNELVKTYYQFIAPPPLREATREELNEDEQINAMSTPELFSVFKEQLKPGSPLDAILNEASRTFVFSDKHPDKVCQIETWALVYCIQSMPFLIRPLFDFLFFRNVFIRYPQTKKTK